MKNSDEHCVCPFQRGDTRGSSASQVYWTTAGPLASYFVSQSLSSGGSGTGALFLPKSEPSWQKKGFWKRIKLIEPLLEPIVETVAMLELATCCILMVYWQFIQLQRSSVCTEHISGILMAVQASILVSLQDKWFLCTPTRSASRFAGSNQIHLGLRRQRFDEDCQVHQETG